MNVLIASGLMVMIVGGFLMLYNGSIQQEVEIKKPNYRGLVQLGLAPSADVRPAQQNDIDTGVRFRDGGGNIFILYDSRTWDTLDYGKTFVGVNG
jgi:hypothetical protein